MLALFTALVLVTSLTLAAFAGEYNLDEGSVTITASESGQTVKHGDKAGVSDASPIITQKDNSKTTDNTITIKTEDSATANVTIKDVNIKADKPGIAVGDSSLNLTVKGDNKIENSIADSDYGTGAGIHVEDGNLTITGDGKLDVKTNGVENGAAAIGGNNNQAMSGTITIEDNAKVTATGKKGAGIGSGNIGEMSGSITIKDNAEVNATTTDEDSGAAIGSGTAGEMSGSITIKDNAEVNATTTDEDSGAAIGSGKGSVMSGSITIEDNANVTATSKDGAAIGSGYYGQMSGNIAISNKATVNASSTNGANIGAGSGGSDKGGTISYFDPPEDSDQADKTTALYRVVDDKGISTGYKSELKDGVLTITVARPDANLTGTLSGLKTLTRWGVETIVFETESATSTFTLADLIAKGEEKAPFRLTHKGEEVTLTLNGEPIEGILK